MTSDARHLGTMLIEEGVLTKEQLDQAIGSQEASGLPLGRVLVEEGLVQESDLVKTLAKQIGIEYVDLSEEPVDPAAVAAIPEYILDRYTCLPLAFDDDKLVVALADPANVLAIDDLRAISGRDIVPRVATRTDLEEAIRRQARFDESVSDLAELAAEGDGAEIDDLTGLEVAAEEAPVVKLMNTIISRAVSLEHPMEIQTGMVFALETYCPASDGYSAARIEEEVVVTETGCEVISLFPAEDLPIANRY